MMCFGKIALPLFALVAAQVSGLAINPLEDYDFGIDSGPKPCPMVNVPTAWDIGTAQGDWYVYATDNSYSSSGCIGCNTVQISFWEWAGKVPKYVLNSCCLLSCSDPRMSPTKGVKCGTNFGSGFIQPGNSLKPESGFIKYDNMGITYTLFVIGFDPRDFLILFGCVTYTENGQTKTYHILRVYTRKSNPSAATLAKINRVISRYDFINLRNFQRIDQGPQCIYV